MTTQEVADRAGLTRGRIQQLVTAGDIQARLATIEETASLYADGRISGIPPSGIRVFDVAEVERFLNARRDRRRARA